MTLDELTPWLFARTTGGIRWGLERTEELLAGVGDPHRHFRSVLIGGTNGKGSVAALCDSALREAHAGRVGLYTSPHLVSFSERVRVDGAPLPDEALAAAAARLRGAIERTGASFFEATTAIAFLGFAEAGVELAVVEVGLGGRLDATNLLRPLVTTVTNVARDHEEYLGHDLSGIAREKGGIFKEGVPALIGEAEPALEAVLAECAAAAGAPLHRLDDLCTVTEAETTLEGTTFSLSSRFWGAVPLRVPLPGLHQARNAALAAELLGLLPAEWRPSWQELARGFATTRWPGRLHAATVRGTTYLLDVAHNPAGAAALAEALDVLDLPSPRVLVTAVLADKDWRAMLSLLLPRVDAAILTTAPSAPESRSWDPEAVGDWSQEHLRVRPRVIPDLGAALDRASTLAPHGTILVTGSFHTVGDAMRLLDIPAY